MSLLAKNHAEIKNIKDNNKLSLSFLLLILISFLSNPQQILASSTILSPDRPAYSYQYIPIFGSASIDSKKVEIQIHQVDSNTYWDDKCWSSTPRWLLCQGTTAWYYKIPTYFSDNLKYNIKSRTTNGLGNIEYTAKDITFSIDNRPPYSYITFPEVNARCQDVPRIYGQAADSISGVVFVRVRLKDITDNTYWNGKEWVTNEIWLKTEGIEDFSIPVTQWKINHQYNAISQAIDFAGLEEGLRGGNSFTITSALKFSANTIKRQYLYGEPIYVNLNFENTAASSQILELPSTKLFDYSVNSIYYYSNNKKTENIKTNINFNSGDTLYSEKIEKKLPLGNYTITAEVEALKLKSIYKFEIIKDTIAPIIIFEPVSNEQFKYLSIPISVNVYDNSNISNVILHVGANSWQMQKTTDKLWAGTIPSDANNSSSITYFIEAIDISGNITESNFQTIYTKEIETPKVEEIIVEEMQNNKYLIGVTNFADLKSVFYRVYYDRGTGNINYSEYIGIIDELNKTFTTQSLNASTTYKFSIVPFSKEITKLNIAIADIPAPEIIIQTARSIFENKQSTLNESGLNSVQVSTENPIIFENLSKIIKIPASINSLDPEIIPTPTYKKNSITDDEIITNNNSNKIAIVSEPITITTQKINYIQQKIDVKIPIIISYNDINNDTYLDGTNIKETTLVILRYDELENKWMGGFETTVNTEQNICTAYVDRLGTYAVFSVLQICPTPVSNLKGTPTPKSEAKLEWELTKSASLNQFNIYYENESYYEKSYMVKYRIYWDKGKGIIDYTQSIAELRGSIMNWTSQMLTTGLYKFAVRVVDIEGTEDKNPNFVIVNINKKGEASAYIKVPDSGKKLKGNAVTVIADATPNTTAVTLQYKGINDVNWSDICIKDTKPPYAAYWDLTTLKNGEYKLRAIAYDLQNLASQNTQETIVFVDDSNWDILETGNPSTESNDQHIKQEKVAENTQVEVIIADGTGALIPKGIVEKENVLEIKTVQPEILPPAEASIEPIGIFREYNFIDNESKFDKEITVILPFKDDNNDNIVDGTDYKVDSLDIYYLDEAVNEWKLADNNSGVGDGKNAEQEQEAEKPESDSTSNQETSTNTVNNQVNNTGTQTSTTTTQTNTTETQQNNTYIVQDTTTNVQDTTPAVQDATPVVQDTAPVVQDIVPTIQETTPAVQDTAPAVQDTTPAVQDTAPVVQDILPTIQETTPAVQDTAPVVQDATPVVQDTAPAVQDTAPAVQDTAPAVQDATPVVQDTAPVVQNIVPTIQETTPAVQDTTNAVINEIQNTETSNQDNTVISTSTTDNQNDTAENLNNNHSGLGDDTNPGQGQGKENATNEGTVNPNNSTINQTTSENNQNDTVNNHTNTIDTQQNNITQDTTENDQNATNIVNNQDTSNNNSGLGDGTNPGQGQGKENSKNTGTDNPNNVSNSNSKNTSSPSSSSNKTLYAKVNHFTIFGIFAKVPKTNLKNVSVYPNPFKPSKGHTQITFDGLMQNIKIKIYTIAGRLVDEFETNTDGTYNWMPDQDLASGVYIYYIQSNTSKNKTTGKIGIIR